MGHHDDPGHGEPVHGNRYLQPVCGGVSAGLEGIGGGHRRPDPGMPGQGGCRGGQTNDPQRPGGPMVVAGGQLIARQVADPEVPQSALCLQRQPVLGKPVQECPSGENPSCDGC